MFKKSFSTEMSGDKKSIDKRFTAINRSKKLGIITIVSVSAAVIIALAAALLNGAASDSAKIYPDITFTDNTSNGYKTIGDYADELGMDFADFLTAFALPEDTSADISADEASGLMPLWKIADVSGYSLDDFKAFLEIPDNVSADTPWDEAISKSALYPTWWRRGNELSARLHHILGDDISATYLEEIKNFYKTSN